MVQEATLMPLLLLDIPWEDNRGDNDAVEVFAIGGRRDELAGRHIGDVVGVGLHLDIGGELFLCRQFRRFEPGIDQRFDLRVGRPAEPRFLAMLGLTASAVCRICRRLLSRVSYAVSWTSACLKV